MQKLWNNYFAMVFLTVVSFSLWSCDSAAVDVTPPSVRLLEHRPASAPAMICGQLEDTVFQLKGGDTLYFSIEFEDDVALSEYKVDIHHNFDCHGHGGGAAPGFTPLTQEGLTQDWSVLETYPLQGEKDLVERWLVVPEAITAGNYHYHIQVLDESGNDSPFTTFYSLQLRNPVDTLAPSLSVNIPASSSFSASKGEAIRFSGQVSDDFPLSQGGNGLLFVTYTDLRSGNTFTTSVVEPFAADVEKEHFFDAELNIPSTLVAGDYRFTVRAHDGVRNIAEPVDFQVEISN